MATNAATVTIGLGLTGVSAVESGLARVSSGLGGLASGAAGLAGTALLGLGAVGVGAMTALGAVVARTGVDFLGLQEQALTAFTTMLGSSSKAQAFYASLQTFAATTPFELPGVTEAAQKLLAFGFNAKDVIPDLTAIGNAVSATGGGQAGMDRVVLALGQMRAKGKVQGDEMLQLTEANINAWQYLATFLHTDVPTAMKRVTAGLVTGQQGIDAIIAGMSKDPKFAGMMEAQSHTFLGLLSNLHDYWDQFAAKVMRPIFDVALKPGLEWLTGWLAGPGQALGARLGAGLAAGLGVAGRAFRGIMGVVNDFRSVLGGGLGGGTIGGTLAVGFLLIADTVRNRIVPAVQLAWRTLTAAFGNRSGIGTFQTIILGIARGVEFAGRLFQLAVDGVVTFRQALAGVWNGTAGGNAFTETLGRIGLALREIGLAFQQGGLGGALRTLWSAYLQPALANAWDALRAWFTGTAIPNVVGWAGGLVVAFKSWATGLWTAYLQPGIAGAWAQLQAWFTGTAVPNVTGWAGGLGAAFASWVQQMAPQAATQLGIWWAQLSAWLTGTALPAMQGMAVRLGTALGGWAESARVALVAALPGIFDWLSVSFGIAVAKYQFVVMGLGFVLGEALGKGIVAWVTGDKQTTGAIGAFVLGLVPVMAKNSAMAFIAAAALGAGLGKAIGTAIGNGIREHFPDFADWIRTQTDKLPDPIRRALGFPDRVNPALMGGGAAAGTTAVANALGFSGQNGIPGATPQPGPAPSSQPMKGVGGVLAGGANIAGRTIDQGAVAGPTIIVNNTFQGPTTPEVADYLAAQIHASLADFLPGGGGRANLQ